MNNNRVNHWRVWHAIIFFVIALSMTGLGGLLSMPSLSIQLLLLAGPVAVLGIPHGALDFAVGRSLLQAEWGRYWPVVFLPIYGMIVVGVIALWRIAPGISLLAFLLVSVWHFGASDTAADEQSVALRRVEILARGAVVITFPAACYPAQVILLFNFLAPPAWAVFIVEICAFLAPIAGLLIACCVLLHLARLILEENWNAWVNALELAGLTILFILAPPILAFGIYFCLLHSLRHFLLAASRQQPTCPRAAFAWILRQAAPMTVVTGFLAALAYGLLGEAGLSQKLTQVIFIGLAALTFPHMLLAAIVERWHTHKGPSSAGGVSSADHLLNA